MCGKGVYVDERGIWEGEFRNNKLNGRAVAHWVSNQPDEIRRYDGEWKDNKRCGRGSAVSDDYVYEGEWENNLHNGQGEIRWSSGLKYIGMWVNSQMDGYGICHFGESHLEDLNRGQHINNQRHGVGLLKYKDGSCYVGDLRNDIFVGQGCLISVKYGHTFEGEFTKHRRKKGKIVWPNGDSWEGHYLEDGDEEYTDDGEQISEGELTITRQEI